MVKIEEISDDAVDLADKFEDLLRRMKARNFEPDAAGSNQEESDEVASTVCTALRK
jgi:pentatricopeptide repeat protein